MKLKISAQADKDIAPLQEVYTYRWDRIIMALVLALLAIGLIIATASRINKSEPKDATPASPEEIATAPAQPVPVEPPAVPDARDFELESTTPTPSISGSGEAGQDAEAGLSDPATTATGRQASAALAQQAREVANTAPSAELAASEPPDEPADPMPPAATRATSDSLFQAPSTTTLSPKIARFVLAASVRDKEPVGAVEDVKPDQNNVARLYAFSEATGMKDQTLHYIWSLNGRKVADVKVPVWSNRWRSYSSKLITPTMKGDWKVELIDGSGQLLANSEFRY